MHVALLTAGSRGDVQPFVALALGLQDAGHRVTVAAPSDAKAFVTEHDISYVSLGIDFQALAQSPEGRGALAGNPRDLLRTLRRGLDMTRTMLGAGGEVALNADALVCHPKTLVGPHVARATGRPVFLATSVPAVVPTRAFPIPMVAFPEFGALNRWTYALVRLGFLPYRGLVNAWRRDALGLPSQPWTAHPLRVRGNRLPVLHAFSSHLVPRPPDWPRSAHVTGTWTLPPTTGDVDLPAGLEDFLSAGDPPVYVGFGSMTAQDPGRTTAVVLEAARRAGVRVLLSTGWGGLSGSGLPDDAFLLDGPVPHDWLFPRCRAVVHHGGAGTTDAGLRAGRPTLVCPFFGDQTFWGRRVNDAGAGPPPIPQKDLTPERLATAFRRIAFDDATRRRAQVLAQSLQSEDGVADAVRYVESALASVYSTR